MSPAREHPSTPELSHSPTSYEWEAESFIPQSRLRFRSPNSAAECPELEAFPFSSFVWKGQKKNVETWVHINVNCASKRRVRSGGESEAWPRPLGVSLDDGLHSVVSRGDREGALCQECCLHRKQRLAPAQPWTLPAFALKEQCPVCHSRVVWKAQEAFADASSQY